jgi:hypothetical protein
LHKGYNADGCIMDAGDGVTSGRAIPVTRDNHPMFAIVDACHRGSKPHFGYLLGASGKLIKIEIDFRFKHATAWS